MRSALTVGMGMLLAGFPGPAGAQPTAAFNGAAARDLVGSMREVGARIHANGALAASASAAGQGIAVGKPAPDFVLGTLRQQVVMLRRNEDVLRDVERRKLESRVLLGKPILLFFWASWCGPCKAVMPELSELHRDFAPKGLQILAAGVRTSVEDAFKIAAPLDPDTGERTWKFPYSFALDKSGVHAVFGVSAVPWFILIDRNGTIVGIQAGRDHAKLRQAVADLVE